MGTRESAQRLSNAGLSALLRLLAESTDQLWGEEGSVLITQFREHLVPDVLRAALRSGRGTTTWLHESEVLHVVLVELFSDHGRVARIAAEQTRDPWAYLMVCASAWVRRICLSACAELNEQQPLEPQNEGSDHLTDLNEMVTLAAHMLSLYAPNLDFTQLSRALLWLAQNPPQRSSHEADDRAAMLAQFPSFTNGQISALANIAWGGRPRRKETSLFAALLCDPEFRPASSPTHIRALLHFRQVIRREETFFTSAESFAA